MSTCNNTLPLLVCDGGSVNKIHPMKNQKQYRVSSSHHLDNKKAMEVIGQKRGQLTLAENQTDPGNDKCATNVGGPGDNNTAKEFNGRMIAERDRAHLKSGVDKKHGSYERYLARKRGWNMVNLECK